MLRLITVVALGSLLAAGPAHSQKTQELAANKSPVNVSVLGYSAQGMFAVAAEGLTEMVRRQYPGSAIVYEPGNPAGGVVMIATGQRPFAIQTPTELQMAVAGEPPYQQKYPREKFRPVARLVQGFAVQVYASKAYLDQHKVKSIADIKARKIPTRVSVNQKGNLLAQEMSRVILSHYGITYDDIGAWGGEIVYLPTRASHDLMQNGKLDMVITAGVVPSAQIQELVTNTPVAFMRLEQPVIDKLIAELHMDPDVIRAAEYPGILDKDLPTASVYFLLTGGEAATDADAYKIAKSLYEHFDYYRSLHPELNSYTRDMLPKVGNFQLHPGAAALYREVGLLGKQAAATKGH